MTNEEMEMSMGASGTDLDPTLLRENKHDPSIVDLTLLREDKPGFVSIV